MRISLRAARVNKDFTQDFVAEKLGVNKKTVSSWEAQKTMPPADKINLLCDLYEVSYDNIRWRG